VSLEGFPRLIDRRWARLIASVRMLEDIRSGRIRGYHEGAVFDLKREILEARVLLDALESELWGSSLRTLAALLEAEREGHP
jgi:hypothetical protein